MVRVPENLTYTLKQELISWLPKGEVSYPVIFPSRVKYQMLELGLLKIEVVAKNVRGSKIEMDVSELDVQFVTDNALKMEGIKESSS
jgi:hypothetical protein